MTLLGSANSTLDAESGSSTSLVQHLPKVWKRLSRKCQASLKSAKDPDGEPYAPFASEKSWNEASGKTGSEKKFYHNVSSGTDFAAQPFCVAEYVEPTPEVTYGHVDRPVTTRTVVAHRQVPLIQRVQKTVEVPRVQFIDRLVDDPAVMRREAASNLAFRDEEGPEQAEATSLVLGGEHRREEDETDAQVPGKRVGPSGAEK